MAVVRTETYFWRFIGVAAIIVCSFNVMVLLSGSHKSKAAMHKHRIEHQGFRSMDHDQSDQPSDNDQSDPFGRGIYKNVLAGLGVSSRKDGAQPESSSVNIDVPRALKKPVWLDVMHMDKFIHPHETLYYGHHRPNKAFLVVGVPTVYRSKADYLIDTLTSLVKNLSDDQKKDVVIVVFVADFKPDYREKVKNDVKKKFEAEVEAGLIQVVIAPKSFYPDMHNLPPLYADKPARIQWRSKQCLDYSFLYYYCAELAEYYIQVEDDIIAEKNYVQGIKDFISLKGDKWSTLEFGARGFIGMLYRAKHLKSLSRFSRLYFWTMPIDWIFRVYNDIFLYGNMKHNKRKPPLFKHVGKFSSLDGQVRKLEDLKDWTGKSELIPHKFQKGLNPDASVSTTMEEYVVPHSIDNPYSEKGFFWAKRVQVGDSIDIRLTTASHLSRVIFASGSPMYPNDSFENTELLISPESDERCIDYQSVGNFIDKAVIDVELGSDSALPIKCIRLRIVSVRQDPHQHPRWLLISEIAIIPQ